MSEKITIEKQIWESTLKVSMDRAVENEDLRFFNTEAKKKIEIQAHQLGNQGYRIHNQRKEIERQAAQNAKLKELLTQSRIYVKINTEDYEDRTVSKTEKAEARKLLTKIDEVLK